jgi:predicted negative regulator of RcsB-dependent stress response
MAEYTTDEERFSALVNFFKDNKKTFLVLFSITSISLIFFLSYQSYSSSQNEKAAALYDAWIASLAPSASDTANGADHFNQLQEKYTRTGYAQLARIVRGSSLAKEEQFDDALEDFNALLNTSSGFFGNDVLNSIAKINIARIELSKDNFSNALQILESFNTNAEHPLVYEVKGDALAGLDKNALALDQYSLAVQNAQNESEKSILQMKINKLKN